MPLWQGSDWDRPLSPTRTRRRQPVFHADLASPGSPRSPQQGHLRDEALYRQSAPARPGTGSASARGNGGGVQEGTSPPAQQQQQQGASTTLSMAVHYVGLAKGELGVLSKRQAVTARPSTAPAGSTGRSPASNHWHPTYSMQAGALAPEPPPPSGQQQDIRHVVDDPVGRSHVRHDVFTSRALHPTTGQAGAKGMQPRNTRWMRAPPQDAPLAKKDFTSNWRPRLLSAGGFSGWKLSRRVQSPAMIARPHIPESLRPMSSPAMSSSARHQDSAGGDGEASDHFPPPPKGGAVQEAIEEENGSVHEEE